MPPLNPLLFKFCSNGHVRFTHPARGSALPWPFLLQGIQGHFQELSQRDVVFVGQLVEARDIGWASSDVKLHGALSRKPSTSPYRELNGWLNRLFLWWRFHSRLPARESVLLRDLTDLLGFFRI